MTFTLLLHLFDVPCTAGIAQVSARRAAAFLRSTGTGAGCFGGAVGRIALHRYGSRCQAAVT